MEGARRVEHAAESGGKLNHHLVYSYALRTLLLDL